MGDAPRGGHVRLETLFAEFSSRVLAYALRRGCAMEEAEAVVSDVFLVVTRRIDEVPPDEPLPWLLVTTKKVLANRRRAAVRQRSLTDRLHYADTHADEDPDVALRLHEREVMRTAMSRLKDTEREILALVAWEGLSEQEAATVLGCSTTAAYLRFYRAKRKLLKEIGLAGHRGSRERGRPKNGGGDHGNR